MVPQHLGAQPQHRQHEDDACPLLGRWRDETQHWVGIARAIRDNEPSLWIGIDHCTPHPDSRKILLVLGHKGLVLSDTMREKSWIGRRLPQIALALVCVAVLIGLVFVGICSKKMEAMIRHDSAMVKAQLQDAYREIQQCDEGSPEMGVAIERIWSNHSIPVIICDGEESITAVRNLRFDGDTADMSGFSERELRRELRKIKESGDSITCDLGAGMRQNTALHRLRKSFGRRNRCFSPLSSCQRNEGLRTYCRCAYKK